MLGAQRKRKRLPLDASESSLYKWKVGCATSKTRTEQERKRSQFRKQSKRLLRVVRLSKSRQPINKPKTLQERDGANAPGKTFAFCSRLFSSLGAVSIVPTGAVITTTLQSERIVKIALCPRYCIVPEGLRRPRGSTNECNSIRASGLTSKAKRDTLEKLERDSAKANA